MASSDETPEEEAIDDGTIALAGVESLKRRRRRRKWLLWLLLLLALGGVALWGLRPDLFGGEPLQVAEPVPEPATAEPSPIAPARAPRAAKAATREAPPSSPDTAPATTLQSLDTSDAEVREEAASLSSNRLLADWLGVDDLLRLVVLAVVNVQEGANPRASLASLGPEDEYVVQESDEGLITALPAVHVRYDAFTMLIEDLDAGDLARLFERFEPLLDEAYGELGFPDQPFRKALADAAAEILATPRIEGVPELIFHVKYYRYADPALEDLSPVQKQLLRTGPRNARRVRSKVREVALALGVPEEKLPEAPVHRVGGR